MADRGSVTGRLGRAATAATVVTALSTTTLAAAGVLLPRTALLVFLVIEVPLGLTALTLNLRWYRELRRAGFSRAVAAEELAGRIATRVVRAELSLYRSVWLWGRHEVDGRGPGVHPIGYARGSLGVPLAFAAITLLEAALVHLLVPWPWLRWLVLLASAYSLVALLGFLASRVVHPHLLTRTQLILREGTHTVATIDRDSLTRVARTRRHQHTSAVEADGHLFLGSQDGTNVDVQLAAPVWVQLPGLLARQRRHATVTALSLHLDDPDAFLDLTDKARRNSTSASQGR